MTLAPRCSNVTVGLVWTAANDVAAHHVPGTQPTMHAWPPGRRRATSTITTTARARQRRPPAGSLRVYFLTDWATNSTRVQRATTHNQHQQQQQQLCSVQRPTITGSETISAVTGPASTTTSLRYSLPACSASDQSSHDASAITSLIAHCTGAGRSTFKLDGWTPGSFTHSNAKSPLTRPCTLSSVTSRF